MGRTFITTIFAVTPSVRKKEAMHFRMVGDKKAETDLHTAKMPA